MEESKNNFESARNDFELACELAIDAVENHLESRRGIWHLEKEDLLCIYDNNPYKDDANARPRQTARIAARIREAGIEILAEGHDSRHYSHTMLLDCSWDRVPLIHRIICDEVNETLRELYSDS